LHTGASHIGDKLLKGSGRPLQGEAAEKVSYGQLLNLVASKFERALASLLVIVFGWV
jgi:hypothetical protein